MVSSRRPTVASKSLAEQLRPVVHVHRAVRGGGYARFDVERARTRIRSGRFAFDAARVLEDAGDLSTAFERTAAAFERTGIASTTRIAALSRASVDPTALVLAWSNAESQPVDGTLRLGRSIAAVVGNAILSRLSEDITTDFSLNTWKWPQCPCCGASPDLALATDTRRTLICWRCDTMWRADQRGCLGCGASAAPTLARVQSPYLGYELAICHQCGRYIKERRGALNHELLVERTLIASLDEAAQERGLRA
jgi:hypothetical protein